MLSLISNLEKVLMNIAMAGAAITDGKKELEQDLCGLIDEIQM